MHKDTVMLIINTIHIIVVYDGLEDGSISRRLLRPLDILILRRIRNSFRISK